MPLVFPSNPVENQVAVITENIKYQFRNGAWGLYTHNQPESSFVGVTLSEKGTANGIATLSEAGVIPLDQLPSYVDDVIEAADFSSLPTEGELGKIYVTIADNKTYRWSGSVYISLSSDLTIGETTQYLRGDRTWTDFFTDVRNAVLTGINTAASQVISAADTVLSALGKLQAQIDAIVGGHLTKNIGTINIQQRTFSANFTTIETDAGKHFYHPATDTTARTSTIAANSSVPYPIGTALTWINEIDAGVVTIAINTDTMRLAGAGTTGSRTLAAGGWATAVKVTSTLWKISGVGLT